MQREDARSYFRTVFSWKLLRNHITFKLEIGVTVEGISNNPLISAVANCIHWSRLQLFCFEVDTDSMVSAVATGQNNNPFRREFPSHMFRSNTNCEPHDWNNYLLLRPEVELQRSLFKEEEISGSHKNNCNFRFLSYIKIYKSILFV